MAKFVAKLGLLGALLGVQLGQFWFTFGIWPQSWTSFFGFVILGIVVRLLNVAVDAEGK